ncbi:MAG: amidohydrolase [Christensenellales bacterium]|jgi:imidazolonepropionase-like amidohydrolase
MILIKGGRLLTMAENDYEKGDILIDCGTIVEVGPEIDAQGADIIEAGGRYVMPGIIDAHCHIGMWEDGMGEEGSDGNEVYEPVTPQLRAIDAINPVDRCFKEAAEAGVTTVVTGPGSANVIGGMFAALKTCGSSVDDMILKFPLAIKAALGENPKRVYGGLKKSPATRMATAAILRESLIKAQEYAKKLDRAKDDPEKEPERDMKLEPLVDVLSGRLPLKIHAHRADDIQTAIRICGEFAISYTIEHCTEGYMISDFLKEEQAAVILGPLLSERSKIELKNLTFKAPAIMHEAGIKFAIMTDHPVIPVQYLPVCAALAVREGLDEMEALRSITINAAQITGIADRVGSIEVGKDADIVIFDGHPLDFRTKTEKVLINGNVVYERE